MDALVEEFLKALDPATKKIYRNGLTQFQVFYQKSGTIKDFLNRVEDDLKKSTLEKERVPRNTLNGYIEWLSAKGYSPKTIRTYVAAIQSLAKYYDIPISLRYVKMPPPSSISKKHPWNIDEVAKFISLMHKPLHKSIAATIVQSGLSLSDLLAIRYGDIKEELEKGTSPLCIDLSRQKTDVPYMTFIGKWAISLLKAYLGRKKPNQEDPLYQITKRGVEAYFQSAAHKMIGEYQGINPCRPHSLRAAFHTILRDHKVDPLYVEFWMGHHLPEHNAVYISKSREGWRQTYREQAEPWLTPSSFQLKP